jgi:hypothetical protein
MHRVALTVIVLARFVWRSHCGRFDRRTEMAKRSLVPETGGLRVGAIRWAGGGLDIEVEPRNRAARHGRCSG